ncbi:MAG: glycine cleavage system aminomethyltransferase GcvT [Alphaproteobacteria bacterium]|nr:glycine cleavage system aminomethyltransferase GcvT [Alphaproteobacteria bacterium]MBF0128637.1 glycine cleavage system aminomethyltransferase GcvT [Alphaproteobacteria bacterium]
MKTTPLDALHRELGARMVPFAGYSMPVQYPAGIIAEHQHTRAAASLFDVSHMGQGTLGGADAAAALETLVPGDIVGLKPGRTRYTLFTDGNGGILDDLMVTRTEGHLFLIVNASRKEADFAHLRAGVGARCKVEELTGRALLALQGPQAVAVMARLAPGAASMGFMSAATLVLNGEACFITRSGYTGEDGFEISVAASGVEALARWFLEQPEVRPAGLGARDSLRLEAGLCLYGNDIDTGTTPVEAGLTWVIGKRRREEGGFPGAGTILRQLAEGTGRRRIGLAILDRVPARSHAPIVASDGQPVGEVTSGGFSPTLDRPVAMGYVKAAHAAPGTEVGVMVRDVARRAVVTEMPFVAHRYYRG